MKRKKTKDMDYTSNIMKTVVANVKIDSGSYAYVQGIAHKNIATSKLSGKQEAYKEIIDYLTDKFRERITEYPLSSIAYDLIHKNATLKTEIEINEKQLACV